MQSYLLLNSVPLILDKVLDNNKILSPFSVTRADYLNTTEFIQKLADNLTTKLKSSHL